MLRMAVESLSSYWAGSSFWIKSNIIHFFSDVRATYSLTLPWLFLSPSVVTYFRNYLFATELFEYNKKLVFFLLKSLSVEIYRFLCDFFLSIAKFVFQKKTYCKSHKKNFVWWYDWTTGCLFIVLQTWSLQTDISVLRKTFFLNY